MESVPHYDFSRFPAHICPMTHTINDRVTYLKLKDRGLCAIYTDLLMPEEEKAALEAIKHGKPTSTRF